MYQCLLVLETGGFGVSCYSTRCLQRSFFLPTTYKSGVWLSLSTFPPKLEMKRYRRRQVNEILSMHSSATLITCRSFVATCTFSLCLPIPSIPRITRPGLFGPPLHLTIALLTSGGLLKSPNFLTCGGVVYRIPNDNELIQLVSTKCLTCFKK